MTVLEIKSLIYEKKNDFLTLTLNEYNKYLLIGLTKKWIKNRNLGIELTYYQLLEYFQ